MRTLSPDRQIPAVTEPAIGADFDEPLDVHRNFLAQIALHQPLRFDDGADAVDFSLRSRSCTFFIGIDLGLVENGPGASGCPMP